LTQLLIHLINLLLRRDQLERHGEHSHSLRVADTVPRYRPSREHAMDKMKRTMSRGRKKKKNLLAAFNN
jgi:hypothetical protein